MAVTGTLVTKQTIADQVNTDIVNTKNARVVWWSGNTVSPAPSGGFAAKLTQMLASDANLSSLTITASHITAAARAFAADATRIRKVHSQQNNPSCGTNVNNGTQVSATTQTVASLITTINNTPGPSAGTLITASSVNNFTSTLKGLADQSEGAGFQIEAISNDGCHCSCHTSCHSSCHTNCHGQCHGSRARR